MGWLAFLLTFVVISALWVSVFTDTSGPTDHRLIFGFVLLFVTGGWVYWQHKYSYPFFRWLAIGALISAIVTTALALSNNDAETGWLALYLTGAMLLFSFLTAVARDGFGGRKPPQGRPEPTTSGGRWEQVVVTCPECRGNAMVIGCPTCNDIRWWYETKWVDD